MADDFLIVTAPNLPTDGKNQQPLIGIKGTLKLIIDSRTGATLKFAFASSPVLPKGFEFIFDPAAPNTLLTEGSHSSLSKYTAVYAALYHKYNEAPIELEDSSDEAETIELEDSSDEAETDDEGDEI